MSSSRSAAILKCRSRLDWLLLGGSFGETKMYSLVGRNFRFDAETEKAYKAWLDGDSRHLFRVAMIFGIAAYAVNYAGDYAISGADIASLFLVRLSIVSTIALTLGVTYFFRDFSPAWAGIALAAITSSANTAIMHFMPDSATFWLPAAQSITALVFVLIVTRYEALIIIAVIMFAVPVSWNFLAADHSSLAAPQAILLATTVAAMALLGHYIDRGKRTIFKLSRDLF